MYERQLLRELESLRPDVTSSNAKVVPRANGIPKPTIIPPLEDDFKPLAPLAERSLAQNRSPVPSSSVFVSGRPSVSQVPVPSQSPSAGSSKSPVIAPQPPSSPFVVQNSSVPPTQVRNAGPPLGGRFVDGTKSMFVQSSSSAKFPTQADSAGSPSPALRSNNTDPLLGGPLSTSDPINRPGTTDGTPRSGGDVDPLGGLHPAFMSASVRVQPMRQRLDAREAASKLANMF